MADEKPPTENHAQTESIPMLPIVLGVVALLLGAVLFAIVLGSSKDNRPKVRIVIPAHPATAVEFAPPARSANSTPSDPTRNQ